MSEITLIFDLAVVYVARFVHTTFIVHVHTCRHCGEVFSSYPDLRQHLDSHRLPPSAMCVRHVKMSSIDANTCLNTRPVALISLVTYDRTMRCVGPKKPEPAPKRGKIVEYLHEDTATAPAAVPLVDELSVGLQEVIRDNWASIHMWLEDPCRQGSNNG